MELTRKEIDDLITKYDSKSKVVRLSDWESMYDDRSAEINYALTREYKPRVVVEYGANLGRCTHDILRALLDNGLPFVFKSYEISSNRENAQAKIDNVFGKDSIKIGGDVMQAKDMPKKIDYLFLDHSHDNILSEWTWREILPRVKKGGLIQIHDIPLINDYEIGKRDGVFDETRQIVEMQKQGILPFEKLYWVFPECGFEGSWWIKK